MSGWVLVVLAVSVAATSSSTGTIYRCPGTDGETMFSDLPCPGGSAQTTQSVITTDMSHLSADEQATLARLNAAASSRSEAAPVVRTNGKTLAHDERRCEAAREGLDRIRATKRRGYRASSAATLDARERSYEVQRDRHCRLP